jgi:hypothetical protein
MKRILSIFALFGAVVVLLATPGPNHKIDWCHFPPGQNGAKVNILSIDVAADGTIGPAHLNHPGDGPYVDGQCANCGFAGAVPLVPCGGDPAVVPACGTGTNGVTGTCVCPYNTTLQGRPPIDGSCGDSV